MRRQDKVTAADRAPRRHGTCNSGVGDVGACGGGCGDGWDGRQWGRTVMDKGGARGEGAAGLVRQRAAGNWAAWGTRADVWKRVVVEWS